MTIKVAINGFGRIGRNILRALYESGKRSDIQIVAINDLGCSELNAHLLKFDSVHGIFAWQVESSDDCLYVSDDKITICKEPDPANLPWCELGVDVVLECTGRFTSREEAAGHLEAGASKVIISAPAKNVDATIVYGINHALLTSDHQIISNASCTTNCLAPLIYPLHKALVVESGLMTTIHAYTNDQALSDVNHHDDPYRSRAAAQSMIPTKTGAAAAVGLVLPELAGRLSGQAVRVPTANVSLVDLTFMAGKDTTAEEVNSLMSDASKHVLADVLDINHLPLVSIDFNHNPASCIFDQTQTRVAGRLVKVMAWYDNEWGFSNRMLDTTVALMNA